MFCSNFAPSTSTDACSKSKHPRRLAWQRAVPLSLLAITGLSMIGCARGVTETTITPTGTWTRKITFHGAKPDPNGGFTMGQKIEDAVTLPQGPEWKITRKEADDEQIITAERTLPQNATIHGDISIKGGMKQVGPILINDVAVRQLSPGVWRYTETFHWKGDIPKDLIPDAATITAIKKALPPALATDANSKEIANQFIREFMLAMFGPNSPMVNEMAGLMAQPELMERRIMIRMAPRLETLLKTRFGEQLKPEQRTALIHDVIQTTLHIVNNKSKANGPGAPPNPNGDDSSSGLVSLFLSVKLPGRITETNGEQDPVKHDVYWAFYPEAAALGDVKLTATCDTNR